MSMPLTRAALGLIGQPPACGLRYSPWERPCGSLANLRPAALGIRLGSPDVGPFVAHGGPAAHALTHVVPLAESCSTMPSPSRSLRIWSARAKSRACLAAVRS